MKKISTFYIRCLVVTLLLTSSFGARASHIVGADMSYQHISGLTYKITVALYGDCGPASAGAFASLPISMPQVCIYNGSTSVGTISLHIDSSLSFVETSPHCSGDSTLCTSPSSSVLGIMKFVYSATYTLPSTSSAWRFVYTGNNGPGAGAGRAAAVTNITAGTLGSIQLIDTLNNSTSANSSPVLTEFVPAYFFSNIDESYSPLAVDPDGDSLCFSLVAATQGTSACGAVGSPVIYSGTAWSPPITPVSAATPLNVTAGSFSFSSANGLLSFYAAVAQRSVVVYNIREYRSGVLVGTSQREMTFLVLTTGSGGLSSSTPCYAMGSSAGTATITGGCSGAHDTLSLSGATDGCGIAFQW